MTTLLGKYIDKLKLNKSKIAELARIKTPRMNDLCNNQDAKSYAEEFYRIITIANKHAGLKESSFNKAVDEIFPERPKVDLLGEFEALSPEARFFKKYTQKQNDVEEKLGIANGKISKYFADKNKRALTVEIIAFADGLREDSLSVFKEIYGEVNT